ncbi:MAG: HupE/UreJ family protein [Myxococcota bacterium]|nr:HupE/UreJ family protein [Myxococcota bacterium]
MGPRSPGAENNVAMLPRVRTKRLPVQNPVQDRRRIVDTVALCVLTAAMLVALLPSLADAHARSVSYSGWKMDPEGATVRVRVSLLELSRLGIPLPLGSAATQNRQGDATGLYLADHLQLLSGGVACIRAGEPQALPAETGWAVYRWRVHCQNSGQRSISSRILLDSAPSHMHFARLTVPAESGRGQRVLERVLTEGDPLWTLSSSAADPERQTGSQQAQGSSIPTYVGLGIEHILSGWDHLAFVLALVLLARSLGEVARLVTGFTVAHSITLAFAVLGWVQPETAAVEAVIGLSVALIAAENVWLIGGRGGLIPGLATAGLILAALGALLGFGQLPALTLFGLALFVACYFGLLKQARDPGLIRVLLAFAFGLVHGFGFAGVLAEMELPTERLAGALLGFNVGVELGQLAVVALLWPLLVGLRRVAQGRPHRWVAEWTGAAICGIGLFWFITRTYGS